MIRQPTYMCGFHTPALDMHAHEIMVAVGVCAQKGIGE